MWTPEEALQSFDNLTYQAMEKLSFLAFLLNILRILYMDQMCRELFPGPSAEYIANSEYGPDVSRDTVTINVYTLSHTNVLTGRTWRLVLTCTCP